MRTFWNAHPAPNARARDFANDFMRDFMRDDRGATAIEYALIATLISVAIIGALTLYADNVGNMFNNISNAVSG